MHIKVKYGLFSLNNNKKVVDGDFKKIVESNIFGDLAFGFSFVCNSTSTVFFSEELISHSAEERTRILLKLLPNYVEDLLSKNKISVQDFESMQTFNLTVLSPFEKWIVSPVIEISLDKLRAN